MRFLVKFLSILVLLCSPALGFSDLKTGDMLFVQNGHNLVECYTQSTYSHVAVVVNDGRETWVYEAEIPAVHRYTLKSWLTAMGHHNSAKPQSPAILTIVRPNTPFNEKECQSMKAYLDKQVGRRYSLRGYVRKVPGNGIHCSQLSAGALEASGRFNFSTPNYAISPADLITSLVKTHHQSGPRLQVTLKQSERKSWCQRSAEWWGRRPTYCLWSCWETIRFWP